MLNTDRTRGLEIALLPGAHYTGSFFPFGAARAHVVIRLPLRVALFLLGLKKKYTRRVGGLMFVWCSIPGVGTRQKNSRFILTYAPKTVAYLAGDRSARMCFHGGAAIPPPYWRQKMYVAPNLATRLAAVFPHLDQDEIDLMLEIAADFADEPGELSLCLAEQLEIAERRIVDDALHGRGLAA